MPTLGLCIQLLLTVVWLCATSADAAPTLPDSVSSLYDVAILGGRVMDPDRHLDTVASVGINGGTIKAISSGLLAGRTVIDARGLVVAPGFIDLLSYNPVEPGVWTKLADGVTTALAMHGGTADPRLWYAAAARTKPPIHYGASFFYTEARQHFVRDRYHSASPAAIAGLRSIAERALRSGALGVSFSLEYVPGISTAEITPLMQLAKQFDVPVFFHARYSSMEGSGTNLDAINEILGYARATGASVHIDHLNSTGGTFSMAQSLALIDERRHEGLDVTACVYPYTYWATFLNSARFDPGWQKRFHISYGDLQLAGSGERLTAESFHKYRQLGKVAVAYAIPEDDIRTALREPWVMISSDAILEPGFNNHPRASGTCARTIAVYVRIEKVISLMDALAKMTILPAKRMERTCAAMRKKGRLQIGADADIVVFDPLRIRDRATVEHPEWTSEGIAYVLVAGNVVKDEFGVRKGIRAGQALRHSIVY